MVGSIAESTALTKPTPNHRAKRPCPTLQKRWMKRSCDRKTQWLGKKMKGAIFLTNKNDFCRIRKRERPNHHLTTPPNPQLETLVRHVFDHVCQHPTAACPSLQRMSVHPQHVTPATHCRCLAMRPTRNGVTVFLSLSASTTLCDGVPGLVGPRIPFRPIHIFLLLFHGLAA